MHQRIFFSFSSGQAAAVGGAIQCRCGCLLWVDSVEKLLLGLPCLSKKSTPQNCQYASTIIIELVV
jgi:hypothetical protein